jgi:hypothetical protein
MHIYFARTERFLATNIVWNHHFVDMDTRHLRLVVGGVLCLFGIAKGTKNTSNNKQQDEDDDCGKCVVVCLFLLFHIISSHFLLFIAPFVVSSSLFLVDCSSGCFHKTSIFAVIVLSQANRWLLFPLFLVD